MRREPDRNVVLWLDKQARTSMWTTSVTVLEVRFGLEIMEAGRRRSSLAEGFERLLDQMGRRVAPFDDDAAIQAANLMASRRRKDRPVELRDTMIAGIVTARNASLATRNLGHFEDLSVPLINPWLA
jgi:toxin FitB